MSLPGKSEAKAFHDVLGLQKRGATLSSTKKPWVRVENKWLKLKTVKTFVIQDVESSNQGSSRFTAFPDSRRYYSMVLEIPDGKVYVKREALLPQRDEHIKVFEAIHVLSCRVSIQDFVKISFIGSNIIKKK